MSSSKSFCDPIIITSSQTYVTLELDEDGRGGDGGEYRGKSDGDGGKVVGDGGKYGGDGGKYKPFNSSEYSIALSDSDSSQFLTKTIVTVNYRIRRMEKHTRDVRTINRWQTSSEKEKGKKEPRF
jgi:hypothetical protein